MTSLFLYRKKLNITKYYYTINYHWHQKRLCRTDNRY